MVLKPSSPVSPGLILYNDDGHGGDFVALYIDDQQRVAFAFDCGDGLTTVRYRMMAGCANRNVKSSILL